MADLILELYSEELPLAAQIAAEQDFISLFTQSFQKLNIPFASCKVFSGPCRITVYADGLPIYLNQEPQIIKGPKIGASKEYVDGFCRKYQIDFAELIQEGEYFVYHKEGVQQECRVILAHLIPEIFSRYTWSNSMKWGEHSCLWPRPLRNILCLFGGRVLHFSYHHLESNNLTFGHKFLSKNKNRKQVFLSKIEVNNWHDYTSALRNNGVLLEQKERTASIQEQAFSLLNDAGLREELCQDLLLEVACTVELPFVMLGRISATYMSLPAEIIITVMKVHQKYFPTYDSDTGKLAPYFLFVSNRDASENIMHGNERVLKARLADAYFLYEKDLQTSLEQRYEQLSRIAFHTKLGSLKDKTLRLEKLAANFSHHLQKTQKSNFSIAAKFCKCDLVGDVVSDLATLQGYMGYYYAIAAKYDDEVALAIRDHYRPAGIKDPLPGTVLGLSLSLIDKIDSLVGMYVAGERSTGNKDPYGLRRFALGIIRIFASEGLPLSMSLESLLCESIKLYGLKDENGEELKKEILNFIKLRHKNLLKAEFDGAIVNSVIDFAEYDISNAYQKALAVQKFVSSKSYEFVSQSFKRIFNLVSINTDLLNKAKQNFCLDNKVSADALIKICSSKYSQELNEPSAIQMLEALELYDSLLCEKNFLLPLANLEYLASALNNFIDKIKVSENTFYVVLLAQILDRFNGVIVFQRLHD